MLDALFIVEKTSQKMIWKYGKLVDSDSYILHYNITPAEIPGLPAGTTYHNPREEFYVHFNENYHEIKFKKDLSIEWLRDNGEYLDGEFDINDWARKAESQIGTVYTSKTVLDGVSCDTVLFRKFSPDVTVFEYIDVRYIFTDKIPVNKTPLVEGDVLWNTDPYGSWLYATRISNGFKLIKYTDTILD